jgi:anti-sigma regulatory factor (Ser/Thr protein kinase)
MLKSINRYTQPNITDAGKGRGFIVDLPARLDLEENFDSTISHFRHIRDAARGRYKIRYLNFDGIRYISPAAALVLASEVDRWRQRMIGKRMRAWVENWDVPVKRLLCEMGLFELLGLPRPIGPEPEPDVTFLRFECGSAELRNKGLLAQKLRKQIDALVGQKIQQQQCYRAISEAMINVGQHAYPDLEMSLAQKRWWQSASFDRRTRRLTVMFYDHGIGIPRTLTADRFDERFRERLFGWPDALKIKAATVYGRSSTGRRERGKGLMDGQAFAKAYPHGHFAIYSGRGLYRVANHGNDVKRTQRNHEHSINGTLFEWVVTV